jgi:hypothetical protein
MNADPDLGKNLKQKLFVKDKLPVNVSGNLKIS